MLTQSSSAVVIPFTGATAPQPTIKRYDRLAWLKQVKVDPSLRSSCFKTSFEAAQYVNVETGMFWASPKTIAEGGMSEGRHSDGIAQSEATVVEDLRRLVAADHLELIDPGRPGRGHSACYRIKIKPHSAEIFRGSKPQRAESLRRDKTSGSRPENLRLGQIKPQPAEKNHRGTIEENHREAALTRRASADVDRGQQTDTADDPRARAYRALKRAYPEQQPDSSDLLCRAAFYKMIDDGYDPDELIRDAARVDRRTMQPLLDWLPQQIWF